MKCPICDSTLDHLADNAKALHVEDCLSMQEINDIQAQEAGAVVRRGSVVEQKAARSERAGRRGNTPSTDKAPPDSTPVKPAQLFAAPASRKRSPDSKPTGGEAPAKRSRKQSKQSSSSSSDADADADMSDASASSSSDSAAAAPAQAAVARSHSAGIGANGPSSASSSSSSAEATVAAPFAAASSAPATASKPKAKPKAKPRARKPASSAKPKRSSSSVSSTARKKRQTPPTPAASSSQAPLVFSLDESEGDDGAEEQLQTLSEHTPALPSAAKGRKRRRSESSPNTSAPPPAAPPPLWSPLLGRSVSLSRGSPLGDSSSSSPTSSSSPQASSSSSSSVAALAGAGRESPVAFSGDAAVSAQQSRELLAASSALPAPSRGVTAQVFYALDSLLGRKPEDREPTSMLLLCQQLRSLVAHGQQLPPRILRVLFDQLKQRRTLMRISQEIYMTLKQLHAVYPSLWIPQPGDWPLFRSLLDALSQFSAPLQDSAASSSSSSSDSAAADDNDSASSSSASAAPASEEKVDSKKQAWERRLIMVRKALLLLKFFVSVLLKDIKARKEHNLPTSESLLAQLIDSDRSPDSLAQAKPQQPRKGQQQQQHADAVADDREQHLVMYVQQLTSVVEAIKRGMAGSLASSGFAVPEHLQCDILATLALLEELLGSTFQQRRQ